jgi:hypothetical protein
MHMLPDEHRFHPIATDEALMLPELDLYDVEMNLGKTCVDDPFSLAKTVYWF